MNIQNCLFAAVVTCGLAVSCAQLHAAGPTEGLPLVAGVRQNPRRRNHQRAHQALRHLCRRSPEEIPVRTAASLRRIDTANCSTP